MLAKKTNSVKTTHATHPMRATMSQEPFNRVFASLLTSTCANACNGAEERFIDLPHSGLGAHPGHATIPDITGAWLHAVCSYLSSYCSCENHRSGSQTQKSTMVKRSFSLPQ